MIKTIVFDLGGVYFTNGSSISKPKIQKLLGMRSELAGVVLGSKSRKRKLYYEGKISPREFWNSVGKELNINKKTTEKVRKIWFDAYKPQQGMPELLSKLHKNYRTIIFSGNLKDRVRYLDQKFKFKKHFDGSLFSFDVGLDKEKENLKIFKLLLRKIKCDPKEAVYIDDDKAFLANAKYLGINVIMFENTSQVQLELKNLGVKV